MGAKTWMVVFSNGDIPSIWNRTPKQTCKRNGEILTTLFPNKKFKEIETGNLANTYPSKRTVQISDFGAFVVVATEAVAIDNPSKIPRTLLKLFEYKYTYVFAMHSVVNWFAFAVWKNGVLIRSLSLDSETGVIEDLGEHLSFEEEYWANKHPATDPEDEDDSYPLPFHPLEFGENTLLNLLGYQYEGIESLNKIDPELVAMRCFTEESWWKFW